MYQIPLQYQNMSCVWNISAPFGSLVRISLQHLYPYSENKQNCPTDNIAIYDGPSKLSNLVLQMCFSHDSWASFKTSVLYSTGSSLVISLRTSQRFRIRPVLIWYEGIWPTPGNLYWISLLLVNIICNMILLCICVVLFKLHDDTWMIYLITSMCYS